MSPHEVIDLLELNAELVAAIKRLVVGYSPTNVGHANKCGCCVCEAISVIAKAERR